MWNFCHLVLVGRGRSTREGFRWSSGRLVAKMGGYKPWFVGGLIGAFKDLFDVLYPYLQKMIQFEKYVSHGLKTPTSWKTCCFRGRIYTGNNIRQAFTLVFGTFWIGRHSSLGAIIYCSGHVQCWLNVTLIDIVTSIESCLHVRVATSLHVFYVYSIKHLESGFFGHWKIRGS